MVSKKGILDLVCWYRSRRFDSKESSSSFFTRSLVSTLRCATHNNIEKRTAVALQVTTDA